MDTTLVKTFLEVVSSKSFVGAAERLFVSQSAVSLRIKSLEEQLGRQVFIRSKSGITLTPAGRQLMRYANSFLLVWEEAKQQVAVPEKFEDVLVVAGEQGLWERLLIRWLPLAAEQLPTIAFRAEIARSDRITRQMVEGTIDMAVMYNPRIRPGINIEHLFDDNMMMVSTLPDTVDIDEDYIFVDWGEEFTAFHASLFPDYDHPRMTFNLGQVTLNYLLNNGGSAFMPTRLVTPFIEAGKLYRVEEIASFYFPVHVAWRSQVKARIIEQALATLKKITAQSLNNNLPSPFWMNS